MARDRNSSEPEVKVFRDHEERDRWQMQQYGRLKYCFRTEDERTGEWGDSRPLLIYPYPSWRDEEERLTYEHAAEAHPRGPDEGPGSYIVRLAEAVEGRLAKAGKSWPRPMSRSERDARLAKLREQARAEAARLPYREAPESESEERLALLKRQAEQINAAPAAQEAAR
jgi:hypothetical protein